MASRAKKTNLPTSVNVEDRISNLPITLVHHILSFLPAHDMVQTCLFSKTWRNVWFSAPSFHIDKLKFQDHRSRTSVSFEQFVDLLLLTRDGSNIQKFNIIIEPDPEPEEYDESESEVSVQAEARVDLSSSKVNAWILYALRHNVQVIDLKSYMSLTPLLFSCESLRELKLYVTRFDLDCLPHSVNFPSSVNLPSLKVLHLHGGFIQAGQLDDALFSAMPCLETLNLEHCSFSLKKLSIESTYKLTTLILTGDFLGNLEVSVSAPNLKCLKLDTGNFYRSIKSIRFKNNCIQLINANIGSGVSCSESMIELFAVLWNTSSLKFSSSFLKSFTSQLQNGMCIVDCIKTPFHHLTHMEIRTAFNDDEALVINNILYHSPCIEVLRIVMAWNTYPVTTGESFEAEQVWSRFKLSRLKLVEINEFETTENQIRLVEFLLENAFILEDMIITTARYGSRNKLETRIVGKKLLLYPRASPTLVVQFG
ncbi:hypothetical protein ACHQM5_025038 [Ranunculus cassubicifolius]